MSRYPDVAISVESRFQPFIFSEDNFDIAIHFGQASWASWVSTFLCIETVVPTASPALAQDMRTLKPTQAGTQIAYKQLLNSDHGASHGWNETPKARDQLPEH